MLFRFFQNIFSRAFTFEFCLFFCLRFLFISNFHVLHCCIKDGYLIQQKTLTLLASAHGSKTGHKFSYATSFLVQKILPITKKTRGTKPFSPPSAFLWICPQPDNIWEFYITYSVEHTALGISKYSFKTDLATYVSKE